MNDTNLSDKKKIRCAIYTRKSCEEGLEQEFNSLDAQRVSAENYISSQSMQGWVLVPTYYDDGGYSGGNLDRPALKKLFSDIQENKIDIVVVYKIDRLTRSLVDFSKIIEIFDQNKVSFVSVTQSFNTANSMGRLMLHVLLSFAQYERELTSERIRDKLEASCKQGIWMGGNIPFGYDVKERKLLVNVQEAKIIRTLFDIYLETNSIVDTARSLNNSGFTTKSWTSRKGNLFKGAKFDTQVVRRILENPIYNGKIKHKDKIYTGQHDAIIDDKIWHQAQSILKNEEKQIRIPIPRSRVTSPPLLKGVLHCNQCNSMMTPTYTIKKGKRYRYYICTSKMLAKNDSCRIGRMTAHELEELVINQILQYLKSHELIIHTMRAARDKVSENMVIDAFKNLEKVWDELFPVEQARIINLLVKNITVMEEGLSINLFKDGIYSLSKELTNQKNDPQNEDADDVVNIFVPMKVKRRGHSVTVIVRNINPQDQKKSFDRRMIQSFAKAHKWKKMLEEGDIESLADISRKEKITTTYVSKLFALNFVSPKIVKRIFDGTQPRDLKLQDIIAIRKLPDLWEEQEQMWGF